MPQADSFPRSLRGGAGVVIAEHAAQVVMVRPDGDAFRLTHTEVPLPPGCLRCGHVVDASALREALSSVALIVGDLPTWLGIFPDDTIIQTFDLGDRSADAAERELELLVAGFVDYGYVGGWEIRSTPSGVSALTVAVPGVHVERYAAAARLSGLVLAGVECTAQALVRGLVHGSTRGGALAGLAVADLGGSRLATAWLGNRAISGGWLGPALPGRTPVTGRVNAHPAVLDLIAPGARAGFAEGAVGWPSRMGFVQGATGRIERLVAAVDAEPVQVPVPSRLVSSAGVVSLRTDGAGLVDPAAWGLALLASGAAIAPVDLLRAAGGSGNDAADPSDPVDLTSIGQLAARLAALPTANLPVDDGEVTWAHPVRPAVPLPLPVAPVQVAPVQVASVQVAPVQFAPAELPTPAAASPLPPTIKISLPPLESARAAAPMRLPDPASFWTSRIGSEADRLGRPPASPAPPPTWRSALDALAAPYPTGSSSPAVGLFSAPAAPPTESESAFPSRPSAQRRPPVRRRVAQLLGRSQMTTNPSERVHEDAP